MARVLALLLFAGSLSAEQVVVGDSTFYAYESIEVAPDHTLNRISFFRQPVVSGGKEIAARSSTDTLSLAGLDAVAAFAVIDQTRYEMNYATAPPTRLGARFREVTFQHIDGVTIAAKSVRLETCDTSGTAAADTITTGYGKGERQCSAFLDNKDYYTRIAVLDRLSELWGDGMQWIDTKKQAQAVATSAATAADVINKAQVKAELGQ